MWGVVAIVVSLALLMALAYRGLPVVVIAPICAGTALALSGVPILPGYTGPFMGARRTTSGRSSRSSCSGRSSAS